MNKKENQGYQMTHQRIKDSLNTLMEQKPLRQITIGALCKTVDINRSTFYAHFQDIYDVLEQIGWDLNEKLMEKFSAYSGSGAESASTRLQYTQILLEHIRSYRTFYRVYLSDLESPAMLSSMQLLQDKIAMPIMAHYQVEKRVGEYYFNFMRAGLIVTIKKWLDDGCPEPAKKLAEIIIALAPAGAEEAFRKLDI